MNDHEFMSEALAEARAAAGRGEVPIGCVIVYQDEIIARTSNRIEELKSPLAHAELLAIESASRSRGRRLTGCTLYVTLEPCAMCAGGIVNARISRVVFGAHDPKAGAVQTLFSITDDERLNHRCNVRSGVCADESAQLLQDFFQQLRRKNNEL